jgi:hypothetical protein
LSETNGHKEEGCPLGLTGSPDGERINIRDLSRLLSKPITTIENMRRRGSLPRADWHYSVGLHWRLGTLRKWLRKGCPKRIVNHPNGDHHGN